MSIYLRVTEESSTKMGILRFSILILFIYFFSNFLHINWCSNSGLLDFRCGGPKKRIAVSLFPGVSSPEGEGTLQPGENSLASLPTGPPCWLWHGSTCWKVTCSEDVSIVFFLVGVTDASQWSTWSPLSIRKVTYGALDEGNIYPKMQVAQMIGSISAKCRMNVSSATIQKMWVLPPVKSRKSSWQASRCGDFLGGDKNGQML